MDKFNYYTKVLKNYVTFSGRARRSEYWYFVLFNAIISMILGAIDGAVGTTMASGQGIIGLVYSLAVLLPTIAVAIRRMHDVGKSGWFMLIPFYNLYLAVQDSQEGSNEYGPNPKSDNLELEDNLID